MNADAEANADRAREIQQDLTSMLEAFTEKIDNLKVAIGVATTGIAGMQKVPPLPIDDAASVEMLLEDLSSDSAKFQADVAEITKANMALMKAPSLPADLRKSFEELSRKLVQKKLEAENTRSRASTAVAASKATASEQALENARPRIKERVSEASSGMLEASQMIEAAEKAVQPFVKILKSRNQEEMMELAKAADGSIAVAKETLESSRGTFKLEVNDLEGLDGLQDQSKSVLAKLLAEELRKPLLQIGRLKRRLDRTENLTRNFRRDVNKDKYLALLEELKPALLEKVKQTAADLESTSAVDEAVKEAESNVEPFNKCVKLTADEMSGMADNASEAIEAAKRAMQEARKGLIPIDESLDEDFRVMLARKVSQEGAADLKKPQQVLGRLDRRLSRTVNLLKHFKNDMSERLAGRIDIVRTKVLKVIRHNMSAKSLSPEQLFTQMDSDGSGAIDEGKFVAYFEAAEQPVGETISLPADDLKALLDSISPEANAISKEVFLEKFAVTYMSVLQAATMSAGRGLGTKVLRQLRVTEVLEVLEGPVCERDATGGMQRLRVKAVAGGEPGWVTIKGNAGTRFLKEISAADAKLKQAGKPTPSIIKAKPI